MSMYVHDNLRKVKARRETSQYAISKYEHLEELHGLWEDAGQLPIDPLRTLPAPQETADNDDESPDQNKVEKREGQTAPTTRIWRTRRRRDAKVCTNLKKVEPRQCAMSKNGMKHRSSLRKNSWTSKGSLTTRKTHFCNF